MKRFLTVLLSLLLLVTLFGGCQAKDATVTIYYTTDMHGRVFADEETIGLDTIAALYDSTPDSLLVDVGDFLHGAPAATLTDGADIVDLMKQAGYFAAAIGNHEFSFGKEILLERLEDANTGTKLNILSANIQNEDETPFVDGTVIAEVAGLKIGLFALTTLDTVVQAAPDAVADLTFTDPVEAAKRSVAALQAEKCDLIIALTHLGSDATAPVKGADIAAQVEGIDAVIDGHSHVQLDEVVRDIPVVAAGEYGQVVGKLTLQYSGGKVSHFENVLLDKAALAEVVPDAEVAASIAEIQQAQDAILTEVVGNTKVSLEGEKQIVRTEETNLGNLTADCLLDVAGADVGLMNGGCIRATIPQGDITKGMVLEAFPYSNLVVVKEVTGAQLLDILEHACGLLPEADGRFAQVSGIRFTLDADAEPRVTDLCLTDGTPIKMEQVYQLATNDYIAAGGDDYPHLAEIPILSQGKTVEEVFLEYLSRADFAKYQPGTATRILQDLAAAA